MYITFVSKNKLQKCYIEKSIFLSKEAILKISNGQRGSSQFYSVQENRDFFSA